MRKLGRTISCAAGALVGLMIAGAAQAANPTTCGVNSSTTPTATFFYDPFNPSTINSIQPISVTLNGFQNGSAKTQKVDFYFTEANSVANLDIQTTGGVSILHQESSPGANATAIFAGGGFIEVNIAGAQTVTQSFQVKVPAGVDLSNGTTLTFGIVYTCTGNGNGHDFDQPNPTSLPGAITFPIKVLSALQANYAGPALDFGNVQGATSATFTSFNAPTIGTSVVNVKSSGPYTVDLASANNYLLKDTSTDTIKYSLHFLGRDLTNAASTFATINCARAGVITAKQLQLKGTLGEAANAKAVASYSDTLTVTITPTNFGGATQICETL